jgi:hypothetical protein
VWSNMDSEEGGDGGEAGEMVGWGLYGNQHKPTLDHSESDTLGAWPHSS